MVLAKRLSFFKSSIGILVLSLAFSTAFSFFTYTRFEKEEDIIRQNHYSNFNKDLLSIVANYEHPLQGLLSAFHMAEEKFTASSFRKGAESRNFFKNFNGLLGVGFIRLVKNENVKRYLKLKKIESPNFELKRLGPEIGGDDLFVIEMIEPIETNQNALGLVTSDEINRKNAAIESMKTGRLVISNPIQLVQSSNTGPGFLLYYPVYSSVRKISNELERMGKIIGWVYAPVLASEIVKTLKERNPLIVLHSMSISDETGKSTLVFEDVNLSSQANSLSRFKQNIAGKNWSVELSYLPSEGWGASFKGLILITITTMFSFVLFFFFKQMEEHSSFQQRLLQQTEEKVAFATSELTTQKDFLQNVIDSIPALVGYWDIDLKNKLANKAYYEFFGHTRESIFNISMKDLFGKVYNEILPNVEKVLSGDSQTFERTFERGEKTISVLAKYIPEKKNGQIIGFFVVVFDVTELKELQQREQQNQANQYTQSRLSLLGEMAAGIAHEINNPLAIIKLKTKILSKQMESDSWVGAKKSSVNESLSAISATVDRIATIIKSMRSISRDAESDPPEMVLVEEVLENVLVLINEKMKSNNLKLEILNETLVQKIFCNKIQIEQVLFNLVSNSIYEVSKHENGWVKINIYDKSDKFYIRVSDSGNGIPKDILNKIMQPFFTTKPVGLGTGMGLSISRAILERHGGSLEYENFNGNTSFVLCLAAVAGKEKFGVAS